MKNWQKALIGPQATLRDAMETIDRIGSQAALVVDANRRLIGTLTDGDTRRALLSGSNMSDEVSQAMCSTPICVSMGESPHNVLRTMRETGLHQLPIIDVDRVVVGLAVINDYLVSTRHHNAVVIMAGGLGSRLQELTRDVPKPMLKVGSRPVLETIIRSYAEQGFYKFYIAVNYKAEQIEAHFGNGHSLGVDIEYLKESQRMGTAGALSLLPDIPTLPFMVTNADLLVKMDYGRMLGEHVSTDACGTMAVRTHEIQVPFGVVCADDKGVIGSIVEKPTHNFLVNAGVYVLSPKVLDYIPANKFFDMPDLFAALSQAGQTVRAHQVDGYWLDIGRLADYERANDEFHHFFN